MTLTKENTTMSARQRRFTRDVKMALFDRHETLIALAARINRPRQSVCAAVNYGVGKIIMREVAAALDVALPEGI